MRRAKPNELRTRVVPAFTAQLSESELREWLPVRFDAIDDPLAAPEPTLGALVQLRSAAYVVVYYGKESGQLHVDILAETIDSSAAVEAFFREVPLPTDRVLWHRDDVRLPMPTLTRA